MSIPLQINLSTGFDRQSVKVKMETLIYFRSLTSDISQKNCISKNVLREVFEKIAF